MTEIYDPAPPPRSRSVRTLLLVALLAFIIGVVLVTWAFTRWEPARRWLQPPPPAPVQTPLTVAPTPPLMEELGTASALPPPAVQPGDIAVTESRVSGLEARLAEIDARAAVASANASRAEGLLIALAARRAVERGIPLGYLEGQLRARFGTTQPRAVAAVITAGQQPVTIARLRSELDRLSPELGGGGAAESWSDAARRTLGTLFVVRKADTPSPVPDQRLARARAALDEGQVDAALAEVARLPGRERAAEWSAAARRWVEAQRALEILETSALTTGTPLQ